MAFQGGPLSLIGITPEFLTQTGTVTAQNGAQLGLGQIWKGSGQTFAGSAGQSLAGNLAGSAVNIGLSSILGTGITGPNGSSLNGGNNVLATTITPLVTSTVSAAINQQIGQSLQSAGPFGPVFSSLGTGLISQAFQGIGGALSAVTGVGGTNYKSFPGGGDEPPAAYGGSAYTLTDIVFSIQPANQGPQAFGLSQAISFPKSLTTLPFNDLANMPLLSGNKTADVLKQASMKNNIAQKAFNPNINFSSNFRTGSILGG